MKRILHWVLLAVGVLAISAIPALPTLWQSTDAIRMSWMDDTLSIGDRVLVSKDTAVQRGDIVIHTRTNGGSSLIHRVVGMPGDRLHITKGRLILNGQAIEEPYVTYNSKHDDFPSETAYVDAPALVAFRANSRNGEVIVPPGAYFVLGDDRDNALDSRIWGFISKDRVIGKPSHILWRKGWPAWKPISGYPLGR